MNVPNSGHPRSHVTRRSIEFAYTKNGSLFYGRTIGFYFPGYNSHIDDICGYPELGNFFPSGKSSAESEFQSMKFDYDEREFVASLTAHDAFKYSRQHSDPDRFTPGEACRTMYDVLMRKFSDPQMLRVLESTDECFLVEDNVKTGKDTRWSNNHDGTGSNWLGLLLMIIRGHQVDTKWAQSFDIDNGSFRNDYYAKLWANMVMCATNAFRTYHETLPTSSYQSRSQSAMTRRPMSQGAMTRRQMLQGAMAQSTMSQGAMAQVQKCSHVNCQGVCFPGSRFCSITCRDDRCDCKCSHFSCNERCYPGSSFCSKKCRDGLCQCTCAHAYCNRSCYPHSRYCSIACRDGSCKCRRI